MLSWLFLSVILFLIQEIIGASIVNAYMRKELNVKGYRFIKEKMSVVRKITYVVSLYSDFCFYGPTIFVALSCICENKNYFDFIEKRLLTKKIIYKPKKPKDAIEIIVDNTGTDDVNIELESVQYNCTFES